MKEEKLYFHEGKVLVEKKYYKTGVEKFEEAIKEFGIDNALEYFATPEDQKHWFETLREND